MYRHKPIDHKRHPHYNRPVVEERKHKYHFILLNDDNPIGCIKGYDDDKGQDVVIYVCGMKNTFHLGEFIPKYAIKDFLKLAASPAFNQTFFGAKINLPGFGEERQLFCVTQNVKPDYSISGSLLEESRSEIITNATEDLDIYPDKNDDDNIVSKNTPSLLNLDSIDTTEEQSPPSDTDKPDPGEIEKPPVEEVPVDKEEPKEPVFPNKPQKPTPYYYPIVNLRIEDKEYGVLLDIDITGFEDTHKRRRYNKPDVPTFDIDPTDDMIPMVNEEDNVIKDIYMR